jgi:hypothetical protein
VAAQDHRTDPDSSPAQAVHSWWHYFNLMGESIGMLIQQRDEQLRYFMEHPDDQAACDRLAKSSELLWLARKGEYGGADI